MRKCIESDKDKVISIISESFDSNPSVNRVIKNDQNRKERIRALSDYAFKTAISRQGVYISSDEEGVAICYKYNHKKNGVLDYWNQLLLVVKAIGINRVWNIMKRDSFINAQRPKSGDYLYFWFFGVTNKGKGQIAAKELKDLIFKESLTSGLPIYLETSVLKNKRVYERYQFETYYEWIDEKSNDILWFMRKMPQ